MEKEQKYLIDDRFITVVKKLKEQGYFKTDKDFCKAINVKPQSFADIKSHRRSVTVEMLYDTCSKFPVSIEYIFHEYGEPLSAQPQVLPEDKETQEKVNELKEKLTDTMFKLALQNELLQSKNELIALLKQRVQELEKQKQADSLG